MFGRKRRKERKAREAAERERTNAEVRESLHPRPTTEEVPPPLAPPPGHEPIPAPTAPIPAPPAPEADRHEAGPGQSEAAESGPSDGAPVIALLTDGERLGFEPELHVPEEDAEG